MTAFARGATRYGAAASLEGHATQRGYGRGVERVAGMLMGQPGEYLIAGLASQRERHRSSR